MADYAATYKVKELFFSGKTTYRNFDYADITVGGDRGDVFIDWAEPTDGGVVCSGISLGTSDTDLDDEDVEERIREIVEFCYISIGGETFTGKARY